MGRRDHRASGSCRTLASAHTPDMKTIMYAVVLGAILGALDGLSAGFEFGFGRKVMTIAGLSSIKSLVVGLLVGAVACWTRNRLVITLVGLGIALGFAYLVASQPDPDTGRKYYLHIMGTGGLVGLIIGYATARHAALERDRRNH